MPVSRAAPPVAILTLVTFVMIPVDGLKTLLNCASNVKIPTAEFVLMTKLVKPVN